MILISSLFVIELSQLTFDDVRRFCDQGFSEGLRIEYKREFTNNLKLAGTICAFANTQGGIILIGVEADKKMNTPQAIPGVELKEGLEERVINICYNNISPVVTPEVKVCDFKSDLTMNSSDRDVVFIRVSQSYIAPHYLLRNNKIQVRLHSRNALADLRTIESLLNRRDEVRSSSARSSGGTMCNLKQITVDNKIFESVVIIPQYAIDPIIPFNKENNDWLFQTINEYMYYNEQRPKPDQLTYVKLNSPKKITRICRIRDDGRITFQRPVRLDKNEYNAIESIELLLKALKVIQKIYSHFGFYGDLAIGLTIMGTNNLVLGVPKQRFERYESESGQIHIEKQIRYDELLQLERIFSIFLEELCSYFGVLLKKDVIIENVNRIIKSSF